MATKIQAMDGQSTASSGLKDNLRGPALWLFNDDFMSVLAFLIIPTVGLPLFFEFSPAMLILFKVVNYFIIGMFILEYFIMLFISDSRMKYVQNPWHLLDLLIIILAILDLIPFISLSIGRASPVLRLLRVFTALGRTTKGHRPVRAVIQPPHLESRMLVNTFGKDGIKRCATNGNVCNIVESGGPQWIDIEDVSAIDLEYISTAIHVPVYVLESKVSQEAFPRIDYFPDYTTVFIWDAKLLSDGEGYRDAKISRNGLLIICRGDHIITICTGKSDLFDEIVAEGLAIKDNDFAVSVLYSILRHKVRDGEDIVRTMEHKTALMEQLPVGKTPPAFLEDTFHLRKDVVIISKNLWHLRQVLDNLKTRKVSLNGVTDEHLHLFDILYDEADYLYETADNITDSLSSLRDLHINTVSYEMTRVMRVLAIITCLALVPSTIGGLLGENILGVPFSIRLGEVGLVVISLMVLELYAFYKMGWLR
jgi:Mg2+ and Co2+ transporter CorA